MARAPRLSMSELDSNSFSLTADDFDLYAEERDNSTFGATHTRSDIWCTHSRSDATASKQRLPPHGTLDGPATFCTWSSLAFC